MDHGDCIGVHSRLRQKHGNQVGFGGAIPVDVIGKLFGELLFQCSVLFDRFHIPAQKIPQPQMVGGMDAARHADIKIMPEFQLQTFGKHFPSGKFPVSAVEKAEWLQRRFHLRPARCIGKEIIRINDRFCRKTGNGGAADMFQSAAECLQNR